MSHGEDIKNHTDNVKHEHDANCVDDEVEIKSCDPVQDESGLAKDNIEIAENDSVTEETSESKIATLENKVSELKDLYLRAQADMQNKDRRHHEDVKKARDYAISSFATDLVTVKDYLEMALKDQSGNFEMLKMGVDLTLKQLIQVFDGHKVKAIEPNSGDKLDPHFHQAVETVEVEGKDSNTVVTVMQKGYSLNERVLRPAMVTVAK